MCGAKYPPAPATTGMLNGGAIDSAHVALDSDCFSNATASTRRCRPACTRLAAIVSCQSITGGMATVTNVATGPFRASMRGDANIRARVKLPEPGDAPLVFVAP